MFTRRFGGRAVLGLAALAALLLGGPAPARAGLYSGAGSGIRPALPPFILVTVDENGNGSLDGPFGSTTFPSYFAADPGPGGLPNVLTYDLLNPPGLVSGDVIFDDGSGGPFLDLVRFNATQTTPGGNTGTLVYYSDNTDGFDNPADTPSPPGALYSNFVIVPELGSEGFDGAFYIPGPGDPGFVAGAGAPVVYLLISDSPPPPPVPEPTSCALFGLGALGLAAWRRRRRTA